MYLAWTCDQRRVPNLGCTGPVTSSTSPPGSSDGGSSAGWSVNTAEPP